MALLLKALAYVGYFPETLLIDVLRHPE